MFYILILIALCFLSYLELKGKTYRFLSFNYLFVFLLLVASHRYGSGGDYFAYGYIYYRVPPLAQFSTIKALDIHGEQGFLLLCSIFRSLHLSYEIFIMFLAVVTMGLIYRFIKRYSKMPIASLTVFYVIYYLIYVFNGLRQGLALAIFLGIGLTLFKEKKYLKFVLVTLFGATMHISILITLILIPIEELKISYKVYAAMIIGAIVLMILNVDMMVINLLPTFLQQKILTYWGLLDIPILAFGNRFVFLALILYFTSKVEEDENTKFLKKIYIIGFILYILTMKSSLMSARLSVYMKALEVILIPNIIFLLRQAKFKWKTLQLWGITMVLMFGLLYKNLAGFLEEGDYYGDITVTQYPYMTVLDLNTSRIWKYRERPYFLYKLKGVTSKAMGEMP